MAPLRLRNVGKSFTMHLRDGITLPVLSNVSFDAQAGACTVLGGPSGAGKSSILRMVYGNYGTDAGSILVSHDGAVVDVATASPRLMIDIRARTIGYVSQFLRVIPRVAAEDLVAEPLVARGTPVDEARRTARDMLARLNLPERLWSLPPATFSGGEQQRVNIARGFICSFPILLLDEPTASLDEINSGIVLDLIAEKKRQGVAMLGIFHDPAIRARVADHLVDVSGFAPAEAA